MNSFTKFQLNPVNGLQNWLFGRKLVDTVCIFTRFNLHILTSDTEAEQFLPIVEHVPNGGSEPFVRLFIHDPVSEKTRLSVLRSFESMKYFVFSFRMTQIAMYSQCYWIRSLTKQ